MYLQHKLHDFNPLLRYFDLIILLKDTIITGIYTSYQRAPERTLSSYPVIR